MKTKISMSDLLRSKLFDSNMKIYEISNIIGLDNSHLYKFLNGKSSLTLRTAEKLMDFFNLEIKECSSEQN